MRIDMHTHIIPPDWPDWSTHYGAGRWPRLVPEDDGTATMMLGDAIFMRLDERFWSPARRLEDMARQRVDMQVLSPIPIMACYWADAKANQAFARLLNEQIADTVTAAPSRFAGMGTLPMQDIDLAIIELRHACKTLGFGAVQIGTCPAGRELDDEDLFPFFEACCDLGVAVFVHPIEPILGRERLNGFYLPNIVGNPLESTLAVSRLICGGVLERLPELKICIAHAGGALSYILGRLDKGYEVRPETGALISRPPSEYARNLYADSLSFDASSLRLAVEKHGTNQVLMGSDYPFALGDDDPLSALEQSGLDTKTVNLISGGNVQAFMGLS